MPRQFAAASYRGSARRQNINATTRSTSAFKLGQLLPHGLLDEQSIVEDLARTGTETGLDQEEIEPTIRSGLDAGRQVPRQLPFLKTHGHQQATDIAGHQELADELTKDLAKLGETDTDNAHRFAMRFGHTVIYTPGRGWLIHDGKRWQPDALLRVTELAKKAARLIYGEAQYRDHDADRAARAKFAAASLSKGELDRPSGRLDRSEALSDCLRPRRWRLTPRYYGFLAAVHRPCDRSHGLFGGVR